jgi:hypothetical protein
LPILVDDDVSTNLLPPALSKIQFVDYRDQDRDAALSLGRAFNGLPPADPLPDPLPTPPDAPISYLAPLAERVSAAAALDYEGQSSLIIDLKRGLRDPETADDSRTLLTRLRKRDDLFAKVAEEIDELLEVQGEAELAEPSRTFVGNQPADQVSPQHTERDLERSGQSGMGIKSRSALDCAVLGGILGLVAGILALAYEGDLADVWFFSIVPTVGGAIAGAMTRQHRVPIFASLAMAFAVSILSVAYEVGTTDLVGIAVIFGAPIGAVIGAIAGTRIRKWRDVPHPAQ